MMEPESPTLEQQVIEILQQMLKKYRLLDELTKTMLTKHAQGQSIESEIESMQRQREQLTQFERHAQPLNEAYRNSRQHASTIVQELTKQTTKLIEDVITRIARLEDAARESHQQLIPEIDQSVRGNQMKQAYGKFGV